MGFGDRYSEYEKPAAYAPLLVQRALALGACSQEVEGQAGKASSPDSVIREQTSYMRHWPLPTLFLSYGSQCHQQPALYKDLSFAQKLPTYAPLLVQRALALGPASKNPKNEPKSSSADLDMLR